MAETAGGGAAGEGNPLNLFVKFVTSRLNLAEPVIEGLKDARAATQEGIPIPMKLYMDKGAAQALTTLLKVGRQADETAEKVGAIESGFAAAGERAKELGRKVPVWKRQIDSIMARDPAEGGGPAGVRQWYDNFVKAYNRSFDSVVQNATAGIGRMSAARTRVLSRMFRNVADVGTARVSESFGATSENATKLAQSIKNLEKETTSLLRTERDLYRMREVASGKRIRQGDVTIDQLRKRLEDVTVPGPGKTRTQEQKDYARKLKDATATVAANKARIAEIDRLLDPGNTGLAEHALAELRRERGSLAHGGTDVRRNRDLIRGNIRRFREARRRAPEVAAEIERLQQQGQAIYEEVTRATAAAPGALAKSLAELRTRAQTKPVQFRKELVARARRRFLTEQEKILNDPALFETDEKGAVAISGDKSDRLLKGRTLRRGFTDEKGRFWPGISREQVENRLIEARHRFNRDRSLTTEQWLAVEEANLRERSTAELAEVRSSGARLQAQNKQALKKAQGQLREDLPYLLQLEEPGGVARRLLGQRIRSRTPQADARIKAIDAEIERIKKGEIPGGSIGALRAEREDLVRQSSVAQRTISRPERLRTRVRAMERFDAVMSALGEELGGAGAAKEMQQALKDMWTARRKFKAAESKVGRLSREDRSLSAEIREIEAHKYNLPQIRRALTNARKAGDTVLIKKLEEDERFAVAEKAQKDELAPRLAQLKARAGVVRSRLENLTKEGGGVDQARQAYKDSQKGVEKFVDAINTKLSETSMALRAEEPKAKTPKARAAALETGRMKARRRSTRDVPVRVGGKLGDLELAKTQLARILDEEPESATNLDWFNRYVPERGRLVTEARVRRKALEEELHLGSKESTSSHGLLGYQEALRAGPEAARRFIQNEIAYLAGGSGGLGWQEASDRQIPEGVRALLKSGTVSGYVHPTYGSMDMVARAIESARGVETYHQARIKNPRLELNRAKQRLGVRQGALAEFLKQNPEIAALTGEQQQAALTRAANLDLAMAAHLRTQGELSPALTLLSQLRERAKNKIRSPRERAEVRRRIAELEASGVEQDAKSVKAAIDELRPKLSQAQSTARLIKQLGTIQTGISNAEASVAREEERLTKPEEQAGWHRERLAEAVSRRKRLEAYQASMGRKQVSLASDLQRLSEPGFIAGRLASVTGEVETTRAGLRNTQQLLEMMEGANAQMFLDADPAQIGMLGELYKKANGPNEEEARQAQQAIAKMGRPLTTTVEGRTARARLYMESRMEGVTMPGLLALRQYLSTHPVTPKLPGLKGKAREEALQAYRARRKADLAQLRQQYARRGTYLPAKDPRSFFNRTARLLGQKPKSGRGGFPVGSLNWMLETLQGAQQMPVEEALAQAVAYEARSQGIAMRPERLAEMLGGTVKDIEAAPGQKDTLGELKRNFNLMPGNYERSRDILMKEYGYTAEEVAALEKGFSGVPLGKLTPELVQSTVNRQLGAAGVPMGVVAGGMGVGGGGVTLGINAEAIRKQLQEMGGFEVKVTVDGPALRASIEAELKKGRFTIPVLQAAGAVAKQAVEQAAKQTSVTEAAKQVARRGKKPKAETPAMQTVTEEVVAALTPDEKKLAQAFRARLGKGEAGRVGTYIAQAIARGDKSIEFGAGGLGANPEELKQAAAFMREVSLLSGKDIAAQLGKSGAFFGGRFTTAKTTKVTRQIPITPEVAAALGPLEDLAAGASPTAALDDLVNAAKPKRGRGGRRGGGPPPPPAPPGGGTPGGGFPIGVVADPAILINSITGILAGKTFPVRLAATAEQAAGAQAAADAVTDGATAAVGTAKKTRKGRSVLSAAQQGELVALGGALIDSPAKALENLGDKFALVTSHFKEFQTLRTRGTLSDLRAAEQTMGKFYQELGAVMGGAGDDRMALERARQVKKIAPTWFRGLRADIHAAEQRQGTAAKELGALGSAAELAKFSAAVNAPNLDWSALGSRFPRLAGALNKLASIVSRRKAAEPPGGMLNEVQDIRTAFAEEQGKTSQPGFFEVLRRRAESVLRGVTRAAQGEEASILGKNRRAQQRTEPDWIEADTRDRESREARRRQYLMQQNEKALQAWVSGPQAKIISDRLGYESRFDAMFAEEYNPFEEMRLSQRALGRAYRGHRNAEIDFMQARGTEDILKNYEGLVGAMQGVREGEAHYMGSLLQGQRIVAPSLEKQIGAGGVVNWVPRRTQAGGLINTSMGAELYNTQINSYLEQRIGAATEILNKQRLDARSGLEILGKTDMLNNPQFMPLTQQGFAEKAITTPFEHVTAYEQLNSLHKAILASEGLEGAQLDKQKERLREITAELSLGVEQKRRLQGIAFASERDLNAMRTLSQMQGARYERWAPLNMAARGLGYRLGFMGMGFMAAMQLRQSFAEYREFGRSMAEAQGVLPGMDPRARTVLTEAVIKTAKRYGASLIETAHAATLLAQTGMTTGEVMRHLDATLMAMRGMSMTIEQAMDLQVAIRAVAGEGDAAIGVLEKISAVQARTAATAQDLAAAVQVFAPVAKEFEGDAMAIGDAFDYTIGMAAEMVSVLRITGKQAGMSMKFIFARLMQPGIIKTLQNQYGLALGTADTEGKSLMGLGDILGEIHSKWLELKRTKGETVANEMLAQLSGGRRVNELLAVMQNYDSVIKNVIVSSQAFGETQRRSDLVMASLDARLNNLRTNFTLWVKSMLDVTGATEGLAAAVGALSLAMGGISGSGGASGALSTSLLMLGGFAGLKGGWAYLKDARMMNTPEMKAAYPEMGLGRRVAQKRWLDALFLAGQRQDTRAVDQLRLQGPRTGFFSRIFGRGAGVAAAEGIAAGFPKMTPIGAAGAAGSVMPIVAGAAARPGLIRGVAAIGRGAAGLFGILGRGIGFIGSKLLGIFGPTGTLLLAIYGIVSAIGWIAKAINWVRNRNKPLVAGADEYSPRSAPQYTAFTQLAASMGMSSPADADKLWRQLILNPKAGSHMEKALGKYGFPMKDGRPDITAVSNAMGELENRGFDARKIYGGLRRDFSEALIADTNDALKNDPTAQAALAKRVKDVGTVKTAMEILRSVSWNANAKMAQEYIGVTKEAQNYLHVVDETLVKLQKQGDMAEKIRVRRGGFAALDVQREIMGFSTDLFGKGPGASFGAAMLDAVGADLAKEMQGKSTTRLDLANRAYQMLEANPDAYKMAINAMAGTDLKTILKGSDILGKKSSVAEGMGTTEDQWAELENHVRRSMEARVAQLQELALQYGEKNNPFGAELTAWQKALKDPNTVKNMAARIVGTSEALVRLKDAAFQVVMAFRQAAVEIAGQQKFAEVTGSYFDSQQATYEAAKKFWIDLETLPQQMADDLVKMENQLESMRAANNMATDADVEQVLRQTQEPKEGEEPNQRREMAKQIRDMDLKVRIQRLANADWLKEVAEQGKSILDTIPDTEAGRQMRADLLKAIGAAESAVTATDKTNAIDRLKDALMPIIKESQRVMEARGTVASEQAIRERRAQGIQENAVRMMELQGFSPAERAQVEAGWEDILYQAALKDIERLAGPLNAMGPAEKKQALREVQARVDDSRRNRAAMVREEAVRGEQELQRTRLDVQENAFQRMADMARQFGVTTGMTLTQRTGVRETANAQLLEAQLDLLQKRKELTGMQPAEQAAQMLRLQYEAETNRLLERQIDLETARQALREQGEQNLRSMLYGIQSTLGNLDLFGQLFRDTDNFGAHLKDVLLGALEPIGQAYYSRVVEGFMENLFQKLNKQKLVQDITLAPETKLRKDLMEAGQLASTPFATALKTVGDAFMAEARALLASVRAVPQEFQPDAAAIAAEGAKTGKASVVKGAVLGAPLAGDLVVTSEFGEARGAKPHGGLDLRAKVGTPVMAAAAGTVEIGNDPNGFGTFVRIRHADGSETQYSHLSAIEEGLKNGGMVETGQIIGKTGGLKGAVGSGNSTGPHLDFRYRSSATADWTDPLPLIGGKGGGPGEWPGIVPSDTLKKKIAQLDVEKNPRYLPRNIGAIHATYCNIYASDMAGQLGATLPHWVSPLGEPASGGRETTANYLNNWLKGTGTQYGWSSLGEKEAQAAANLGFFSVASRAEPKGSGHIAVLIPGANSPFGPAMTQAGSVNAASTRAHMIWTYKEPQYFTQDAGQFAAIQRSMGRGPWPFGMLHNEEPWGTSYQFGDTVNPWPRRPQSWWSRVSDVSSWWPQRRKPQALPGLEIRPHQFFSAGYNFPSRFPARGGARPAVATAPAGSLRVPDFFAGGASFQSLIPPAPKSPYLPVPPGFRLYPTRVRRRQAMWGGAGGSWGDEPVAVQKAAARAQVAALAPIVAIARQNRGADLARSAVFGKVDLGAFDKHFGTLSGPAPLAPLVVEARRSQTTAAALAPIIVTARRQRGADLARSAVFGRVAFGQSPWGSAPGPVRAGSSVTQNGVANLAPIVVSVRRQQQQQTGVANLAPIVVAVDRQQPRTGVADLSPIVVSVRRGRARGRPQTKGAPGAPPATYSGTANPKGGALPQGLAWGDLTGAMPVPPPPQKDIFADAAKGISTIQKFTGELPEIFKNIDITRSISQFGQEPVKQGWFKRWMSKPSGAEKLAASTDPNLQIKYQLATMGGAMMGTALGGGGKWAQTLSSVGTMAGMLIPGLGPISGPLVGGTLGLLGRFLDKPEKPKTQLEVLQAIERDQKETIQTIQAQTDALLKPENRLLNLPSTFNVPAYNPNLGQGGTRYEDNRHFSITVTGGGNAPEIKTAVREALDEALGTERRNRGWGRSNL